MHTISTISKSEYGIHFFYISAGIISFWKVNEDSGFPYSGLEIAHPIQSLFSEICEINVNGSRYISPP